MELKSNLVGSMESEKEISWTPTQSLQNVYLAKIAYLSMDVTALYVCQCELHFVYFDYHLDDTSQTETIDNR